MSDVEIPFDPAVEAAEDQPGPYADLSPEAPVTDAMDQSQTVDLDEDDYR